MWASLVKVFDLLSKTLHLSQTPVFSSTFFDIFESIIAKTCVFIDFFDFLEFQPNLKLLEMGRWVDGGRGLFSKSTGFA